MNNLHLPGYIEYHNDIYQDINIAILKTCYSICVNKQDHFKERKSQVVHYNTSTNSKHNSVVNIEIFY